jgi:hypothetical protein
MRDNQGKANKLTDDDGLTVFDRETFRPPLPRVPLLTGRKVHTLDAFAKYVLANLDGLDAGDGCIFWIHVASPSRVVYDLVPTLLGLAELGDRNKILKMMRTTVRKNQEVIEDDMGGQMTKTETSAGPVEWTHEDNPLSLAPWRTFPEVSQPLGLFVFRWNQSGQFKLVATPDERWRLEAVESVAKCLREKLGGGSPPVFA